MAQGQPNLEKRRKVDVFPDKVSNIVTYHVLQLTIQVKECFVLENITPRFKLSQVCQPYMYGSEVVQWRFMYIPVWGVAYFIVIFNV